MPVSGFDPLSLHCLSYLHYLLGERQLLDPRAEPRDRTGVGVKGNRFIWCNQERSEEHTSELQSQR